MKEDIAYCSAAGATTITVAAQDWGMGGLVNPVQNVRRPRNPISRERRLLPGELARILAATGSPSLGDVIRFAIATGMRRGEIAHMNFETYEKESSRTASGEFHREVVSDFLLKNTLADVIRIGSILDQVKKGLFYGKPLCGDEIKTESFPTPIDPSRIDTDLLHAAFGVLTESVEILEALQDAMEGGQLDRVNLMEELGDIEWYLAMAYRSIGTTPGNVREMNIAKLKARYPDKFTEEHAINRDLIQERCVLESSGGKE